MFNGKRYRHGRGFSVNFEYGCFNLLVSHDSVKVLTLHTGLLSGLGNIAVVLLEYGLNVLLMKGFDDGLFGVLKGKFVNGFLKVRKRDQTDTEPHPFQWRFQAP